jgi:hypothetical protein
MRPLAVVALLLSFCIPGCRPMPTVDPTKLERAVKSMEKAAAATSEAIDAAREATVQPEEPEVEVSR